MDRIRAIMQRVNPRQRRSPESSSDSEDYEEDYHSEDSDGNDSKNNANDDNEPDAYYPGLFDVFKTRYLLQWKVVADGLPAEIVDLILDEAEYWASTETKMQRQTVIVSDHDRELLRTGPLCYEKTTDEKPLPHRTIHPCRKIVFSLAAHDQGWGGDRRDGGIYSGSYTWFDADVVPYAERRGEELENNKKPERKSFGPDDPNLLPTVNKLQSNPTAVKKTQAYNITWHYRDNIAAGSTEAEEIQQSEGRGGATLDGRRVREMQLGDTISVWGRARFGGWSNDVQRLRVRVFWAV